MDWADTAIAIIVLIGAYKGFKAGFINELMGIVALACGAWGCFSYGGFLDDVIAQTTKLGAGSSHAVGLLIFGAAVYAIISISGFLLNRLASSRFLKTGNAVLGASVGLSKAMVFIWAVLYIVLFFPLTTDLRRDLHQSTLAAMVTQPNQGLDEKLLDTVPPFAKPYVEPFFQRHHV